MIDRDMLRSGMITQTHSGELGGNLVEYVLSPGLFPKDRCRWSHNGIVVYWRSDWWTIDAFPKKVRLTNMSEWDARLASNPEFRIEFLWPKGAIFTRGINAAEWVLCHGVGQDYPELTAARLAVLKFWNTFPYRIRSGHQYEKWCTLWVRDGWKHAGCDWSKKASGSDKENPTPKTVQNRIRDGVLEMKAHYGAEV